MPSIVGGDNISDNLDGVDISEIPFNDKPLGEFTCAVVLNCNTSNHIVSNSTEAPEQKQSSFIVNSNNSTPKLCISTIVDDVTNNVGKMNLLSSIEDDFHVVISIAEADNNKDIEDNSNDPAIVPSYQVEMPLLVPAEDSKDERDEGRVRTP